MFKHSILQAATKSLRDENVSLQLKTFPHRTDLVLSTDCLYRNTRSSGLALIITPVSNIPH